MQVKLSKLFTRISLQAPYSLFSKKQLELYPVPQADTIITPCGQMCTETDIN